MHRTLLPLLPLLLLTPTASAQLGGQPVLLGDLRPGPLGSSPLALTDVNGTLYFSADDGVNGRELWKSDGTPAGTSLVVDLAFGTASGVPGVTAGFGSLGGELYFPALGNQLWKTDGTAAGTVPVKDFLVAAAPPEVLMEVGGVLYLAADDGISGRELWKTDGTTFGTLLVKDINPGPSSSIVSTIGPGHAELIGRLCFAADDGTSGTELWWSDGTPSGTVMTIDMNVSGGSSPDWLVSDGAGLWWVATTAAQGREIFRIDAVFGGPSVHDVDPGTFSSNPMNLHLWQGDLYFAASPQTDPGHEPWVWSSSGGGTKLGDLNPGLASSIAANPIAPFAPSGDRLYFRADDGSNGAELWKTDGTVAGTEFVKDIQAGAGSSAPSFLTDLNGDLFFAAQGAGGSELWRSNGEAAGTLPFFEIHPTGNAAPDQLTVSGGTVYLVASDGVSGRELWAFDAVLSGSNYCTSGTSASGCQASLSADGIASASEASGFPVTVSGLPAGQDGILFFGRNGAQASPWGNGTSYQCVIPPVKRTGLQSSSGGVGACAASFQLDFNAYIASKPHKAPAVGDRVQIQGWYRDPQSTSNQTTSLSDALEFTYCP